MANLFKYRCIKQRDLLQYSWAHSLYLTVLNTSLSVGGFWGAVGRQLRRKLYCGHLGNFIGGNMLASLTVHWYENVQVVTAQPPPPHHQSDNGNNFDQGRIGPWQRGDFGIVP